MKNKVANVIYLGILPAMGTYILLFSMFHTELDSGVILSSESNLLLKITGLVMCAMTWFSGFHYWNSFVREFTIQMTEEEHDEYSVELEHQAWLDSQESQEHWDETEQEMDNRYKNPEKVQIDSYYKGVCQHFIVEHPEKWMKVHGSWGNGYVIISSDHPYCGFSEDMVAIDGFHQEITFAGTYSADGLFNAGIKPSIAGDFDQYWVFGFDTLHSYNNSSHDKVWVRDQAIKLESALQKALDQEYKNVMEGVD
tara:strand:- start:4687 stop:5445 length:759 start_codon:yes stop_codon:yes gene_type:complete